MSNRNDSAVFILVTRAPTATISQITSKDKKHYRVAVSEDDLEYEYIHSEQHPSAEYMWKIFYTCAVFNTKQDAWDHAIYLEKEHNTTQPLKFLDMTSCHFPTLKNATAGWE